MKSEAMSVIKKFIDFINEKFETVESGNWVVYDKESKVIGCNLSHSDATKLSKTKGEHIISGQNGRTFSSIDDAQNWLDMKVTKSKSTSDENAKELEREPVRKVLKSLSNLVKRRFKEIDQFLFSYWVGKFFGISNFLFVSDIERSQHVKDVHYVYCIVGEYYYDWEGFYTHNELMSKEGLNKWNMNDFTYKGNTDTLKMFKSSKSSEMTPKMRQELLSTILNFRQNTK